MVWTRWTSLIARNGARQLTEPRVADSSSPPAAREEPPFVGARSLVRPVGGLAARSGGHRLPHSSPSVWPPTSACRRSGQDVLYQLLGMLAVASVLGGVRRWRPPRPTGWYLLAGGLAMFSAADGMWFFYDAVLQQGDPRPLRDRRRVPVGLPAAGVGPGQPGPGGAPRPVLGAAAGGRDLRHGHLRRRLGVPGRAGAGGCGRARRVGVRGLPRGRRGAPRSPGRNRVRGHHQGAHLELRPPRRRRGVPTRRRHRLRRHRAGRRLPERPLGRPDLAPVLRPPGHRRPRPVDAAPHQRRRPGHAPLRPRPARGRGGGRHRRPLGPDAAAGPGHPGGRVRRHHHRYGRAGAGPVPRPHPRARGGGSVVGLERGPPAAAGAQLERRHRHPRRRRAPPLRQPCRRPVPRPGLGGRSPQPHPSRRPAPHLRTAGRRRRLDRWRAA